MQPAGGIDEEHVDASCDRRLRSIEDDRGGIGAFGALDEFDPEPLPGEVEEPEREIEKVDMARRGGETRAL